MSEAYAVRVVDRSIKALPGLTAVVPMVTSRIPDHNIGDLVHMPWIDTSGAVARSLRDRFEQEIHLSKWLTGSGNDYAGWANAIAALNALPAGGRMRAIVPPGRFVINGVAPTLTREGIQIEGAGPSASQFAISSAAATGRLLNIAAGANDVTMKGIGVACTAGLNLSQSVFAVDSNDVTLNDIDLQNTWGIVLAGANGTPSRLKMRDINGGGWRCDLGGIGVEAPRFVSLEARNIIYTGTALGSSTSRAIKGVVTGLSDGMALDLVQLWSPGSIPVAVELDFSAAQLVNFQAYRCVFDGTREKGFWLKSTGGSNLCRNINLHFTRIETFSGAAVLVEHGGNSKVNAMNIVGSTLFCKSGPAVRAVETATGKVEGFMLNSSMIYDSVPSPSTVEAAVEMGVSDFNINSNMFVGTHPGGYTGTQWGVKTVADVDDFAITGNNFSAPAGGVSHFAYAAGSSRRVNANNTK